MRKYISILILCLLPIFLISCTTFEKITTQLGIAGSNVPIEKEQEEGWEYGRLVFMGGGCVAWFNPDLSVIGPGDMEEYFKKNDIEPVESKILVHFASLGWEIVEETQKDEHTVEYKLKREKIKNYVSD